MLIVLFDDHLHKWNVELQSGADGVLLKSFHCWNSLFIDWWNWITSTCVNIRLDLYKGSFYQRLTRRPAVPHSWRFLILKECSLRSYFGPQLTHISNATGAAVVCIEAQILVFQGVPPILRNSKIYIPIYYNVDYSNDNIKFACNINIFRYGR